jgi:hypothetical protein
MIIGADKETRDVDDFYDRLAETIAQHGRSIMGVFDNDGDQLPFTYTIGNSSRPTPMPELLVIGTARGDFLDDLSQMMIDSDAAFEDGQIVLIPGGRMPVKIIRANNTARMEYALQAGRYFGQTTTQSCKSWCPIKMGSTPMRRAVSRRFQTRRCCG